MPWVSSQCQQLQALRVMKALFEEVDFRWRRSHLRTYTYSWTKPPLRRPVAERQGLKKSKGTDMLRSPLNGVSSRCCYRLLDVHEREASLTFWCGPVSVMTWCHLCSTGRHRTSGEPWASGGERLSGECCDVKKPVCKNYQLAHMFCVWCTAGGERRLGGSRSPRSNRDPWGVWRKSKIDSVCMCVCVIWKQCESSYFNAFPTRR